MDDSHGVGACGPTGRGSPEQLGVHGKIDVLSGTLGKAMGGAAGGYITGKKDLLHICVRNPGRIFFPIPFHHLS